MKSYMDGEVSHMVKRIYISLCGAMLVCMAVVAVDGKYGVVRRDGGMEYAVKYDRVKLFSNGSIAFGAGDETVLRDSGGEIIYSGFDIELYACGEGYQIRKGGKHGLLNEKGEQILSPVYDYIRSHDICGSYHVLSVGQYGQNGRKLLVKTEDEDELGQPETYQLEVFLQNHITPRAEAYMEFMQSGVIGAEERYPVNISELQTRRKFGKLYRMGEKGELVLYFYSEPYVSENFPLSDSGFFVFRDGEMEELISGSECGGSARGDHICFWYDKEEHRRMLGICGAWGGFGGYAYGGDIYELGPRGAELTASYSSVSQETGNYAMEELKENAELFYDNKGMPYTAESIADTPDVTEYEVNEERTMRERFLETTDRYRYMDALDLWYN